MGPIEFSIRLLLGIVIAMIAGFLYPIFSFDFVLFCIGGLFGMLIVERVALAIYDWFVERG